MRDPLPVLVLTLGITLLAGGESRAGSAATPASPAFSAPFACLSRTGPRVILSGAYPSGYVNTKLAANTVVDARGATLTDSDDHPGLVLGGGSGICLVGGSVLGAYPRDQGWAFFHDSVRNNGGVEHKSQGGEIEGTTIDNVEDGVRFRGDGFAVRAVHGGDVHDDCIDDHELLAGSVTDSLFDGCYVFISARPNAGQDGTGKTITLRGLVAYHKAYPDPTQETLNPGEGALFKWGDTSPSVILEDNVFRADQGTDAEGHGGIPSRVKIEHCHNNTMVWLGPGTFPGDIPNDPVTGEPCLHITTDKAVWDRAWEDWIGRHATSCPEPGPDGVLCVLKTGLPARECAADHLSHALQRQVDRANTLAARASTTSSAKTAARLVSLLRRRLVKMLKLVQRTRGKHPLSEGCRTTLAQVLGDATGKLR